MNAIQPPVDRELTRLSRQLEKLRQSFDSGLLDAPCDAVARTKDYLLIRLGIESYGYDVFNALEILPVPPIVPLPNVPAFILGIINFRGRLVSVTSIHGLFGLQSPSIDENSRIIVTKHTSLHTGILVDEVEGMIEVRTEDIQSSAASDGEDAANFVAGHVYYEQRLVSLLDLDAVSLAKALQLPR